MKSENFQALASELTQLTPHQRSILSDRLREIEHASVSRTLIEERLSNKPLCPKCSKEHIVRWGSASKLQRYRCQDCKITFNALTGTPLAGLRHKDKWLCYIASSCLREEVFVVVPGLAVYIIRLRFAGGIVFWLSQARINPSS